MEWFVTQGTSSHFLLRDAQGRFGVVGSQSCCSDKGCVADAFLGGLYHDGWGGDDQVAGSEPLHGRLLGKTLKRNK